MFYKFKDSSIVSRFLVYGLYDPRDGTCRYIGESSVGLERPFQHESAYSLRTGTNKWKNNWIKKIHRLGLEIELKVFAQVSSKREGLNLESKLIQWHKSNGNTKFTNARLYGTEAYRDSSTNHDRYETLHYKWASLGKIVTITPEQKQQLPDLKLTLTNKEIAAQFGVELKIIKRERIRRRYKRQFRTPKKFDPQRLETLIKEGKTNKENVDELNISIATVSVFKRTNLPGYLKREKIDAAEAYHLYKQGVPLDTLDKKYNVTKGSVFKRLIKIGYISKSRTENIKLPELIEILDIIQTCPKVTAKQLVILTGRCEASCKLFKRKTHPIFKSQEYLNFKANQNQSDSFDSK